MRFNARLSGLAMLFAVSVAGVTPAYGASINSGNIGLISSRVRMMQQNINAALHHGFGFTVNEFTSAEDAFAGVEKDVLETTGTEIAIQNALSTAAMRVANSVTRVDQMQSLINIGADSASVNAQAVMLCTEVAGARALVAGSKLRATTSFDAGIYAQGTALYFSMSSAIDDAVFVTQTAQCGF